MSYESEIEFYRENGYVLVRGLLDRDEAAAFRTEAHAFMDRVNRRDVNVTWKSAKQLVKGMADMGSMTGTDAAGDAMSTTGAMAGEETMVNICHDVQFYAAAFSRLIVDPRFTDVAAALIGSPDVQLHHTKMFIKPPEKGSPFPMHQDYPFMPHAKHTMAAAIFHFDDAPEEKGCVRVVPGSHKRGPLPHDSNGAWHLPLDQWPLDRAVACEAEAGDVLFFSYLTVHGSGINRSQEARTTLLVQFCDPTDTPTEDRHTKSLGQGMMLRGVRAGGEWSARGNPL